MSYNNKLFDKSLYFTIIFAFKNSKKKEKKPYNLLTCNVHCSTPVVYLCTKYFPNRDEIPATARAEATISVYDFVESESHASSIEQLCSHTYLITINEKRGQTFSCRRDFREEVGGIRRRLVCLWAKQVFALHIHAQKMNLVLKAISPSDDEKLNSSRVLIHLKLLKSNRK